MSFWYECVFELFYFLDFSCSPFLRDFIPGKQNEGLSYNDRLSVSVTFSGRPMQVTLLYAYPSKRVCSAELIGAEGILKVLLAL